MTKFNVEIKWYVYLNVECVYLAQLLSTWEFFEGMSTVATGAGEENRVRVRGHDGEDYLRI